MFQGDCENDGSDLEFYMERMSDRLKNVCMVVCLDGGCGNYESLWSTTSYRGIVGCDMSVGVLESEVNSGIGSGMVACPYRIMRQLLERIEYSKNGDIIEDFQVLIV